MLTAAAIGERSFTASDSEESEYEEVEIEEEIEVEEEVTGDEEEDDDEEEEGNGDDLSLSIDDRYDEKRNTAFISNNMKSSQYDGGIMTAEITNPMNTCDKLPHFDTQISQVNTKDISDAQQTESRWLTAMEIMETNKCPALISKSFAKGVSEGTRSKLAMFESSEINPISQKENPATNNLPVNSVNSLHDQTNLTQVNRKDVNDAQQKESTRLDIDPATEYNEDIHDTCCKFRHINETTNGLSQKREVDIGLVCPDNLTGQSLSKKRKNHSTDRNHVFSDSGLLSSDSAGPDPLTNYEIRSSQQVTRTRVSDTAGRLMGQAMGSVSHLIKCYDKKVKTVKRLRDRIKRYREKKLRNAKRLKKLKCDVQLMSEKEKEMLRVMADKEAEHKKQVCDLMEKLEKAYRENVKLQRENVGIASRLELDRSR